MTEDNRRDTVFKTEEASEHPKKHALTPAMEANKWKPGQSGNPGGRPKNSFGALLREYLDANDLEEKRAIIKELVAVAKKTGMRGQMPAMKEILDREDGKVPDTHKIESDVPINIVFKPVERKDAL